MPGERCGPWSGIRPQSEAHRYCTWVLPLSDWQNHPNFGTSRQACRRKPRQPSAHGGIHVTQIDDDPETQPLPDGDDEGAIQPQVSPGDDEDVVEFLSPDWD
jgi:hypothetical protein